MFYGLLYFEIENFGFKLKMEEISFLIDSSLTNWWAIFTGYNIGISNHFLKAT